MPITIAPQEGPQYAFMTTPADVCIFGGAAGGGKSFALLLDPLRHIKNPGFGGVIFRQNYKQIHSEGGLFDQSQEIYSHINGAVVRNSPPARWIFKSGAKVSFDHIEGDRDLYKWQGSQICYIGFDEVTHFPAKTFFYMLSRNRSTCGIRPYLRATCNPDPDSWVAKFIEWWIDQDTGYPIPERSGVLRWFLRFEEAIYWADDKEELISMISHIEESKRPIPKTATFIMSKVDDNKILMETNPDYISNLHALPLIEREQLLHGNWKIRPAAGLYFQRIQVGNMLEFIPADVVRWVRAWDMAATSEEEGGDPAYTAGILIGERKNGRFVVADVINVRKAANDVRQLIKLTAQTDKAKYKRVRIRLNQDPGQAGKAQAQSYIKFLAGFDVTAKPESGSKEVRAEPMAAQWQAGNFDVLVADWNEMYFNQLESFPVSRFKDMVDAGSSAFDELEQKRFFDIRSLNS